MRCGRCGAELSDDGRCFSCGAEGRPEEREPQVQILSPAERNAYRGVTIDEGVPNGGAERTNIRFERTTGGWNGFSYMTSGASWKNKALLFLIAAVLLFFFFFIALPVALTMIVLSMVSWIIYRLLS